MKKADWVVVGGAVGEVSHCTRCGEGLRLVLPLRIEVFIAATLAFVKAHSLCPEGKYFEKPVTSPVEWAASRDTGTSSLTIYSAVTGLPSPRGRYDIPYVPHDFGRCYRLLKLFPAWRGDLAKTILLCKKWKPFVEHWDELTALFEQESPSGLCPHLYERMKALEKGIEP